MAVRFDDSLHALVAAGVPFDDETAVVRDGAGRLTLVRAG